eukprot:585026-Pleurochrysis_carterae.AAC.2
MKPLARARSRVASSPAVAPLLVAVGDEKLRGNSLWLPHAVHNRLACERTRRQTGNSRPKRENTRRALAH